MTDLRTLEEAFAELEQRADGISERPLPVRQEHPHRGLLVAASVVTVGALAVGTAVVAARHDTGGPTPAGAGAPRSTTPSHSATATGRSATKRVTTNRPKREPAHHVRSQADSGRLQVPPDTDTLISEFHSVLGDSATFTVTYRDNGIEVPAMAPTAPAGSRAKVHTPKSKNDSGDAVGHDVVISGLLTAADGSQGGYDLQILSTSPGEKAQCDDPDRSTCDTSSLPDGSTVAIGHEPVEGGGVTYQGDIITPDGVELVMHVSNESDPKGLSKVLNPQPPLSLDQLKAVVTSDRWAND